MIIEKVVYWRFSIGAGHEEGENAILEKRKMGERREKQRERSD